MPIVKSVGGIAAGRRISSWTGTPRTLPTKSCRAMSTAHLAAPFQRIARSMRAISSTRPTDVHAGSPIAASSVGMTATIDSGVSP